MVDLSEREIIKKINLLEKRVDLQNRAISEMQSLLREIRDSTRTSQSRYMKFDPQLNPASVNTLLSVYDRSPNPWSIQTGQALSTAISVLTKDVQQRLTRASATTYEETLDALRSSSKGLTAEEVGKKTGRSRNTESTYLWRLYLAGLVDRIKSSNKIIYKIKETQKESR